MAKIGYLFLSKGLPVIEDKEWMNKFGCERIIEEDTMQEKLRPEWRRMLSRIEKGDIIVVSKLSNALRGIRELGAFLDLCRIYSIRLVSIHDMIDSEGVLFPATTVSDILNTIGSLSSEVTALRRSEERVRSKNKVLASKKIRSGLRKDREKTVVNMYNSGYSIEDIWKASGYKSRTSVFRVLNRNNVQLNRSKTIK